MPTLDYAVIKAELLAVAFNAQIAAKETAGKLATTEATEFVSLITNAADSYDTIAAILYATGGLTTDQIVSWKQDSANLRLLGTKVVSVLSAMKTNLTSVSK